MNELYCSCWNAVLLPYKRLLPCNDYVLCTSDVGGGGPCLAVETVEFALCKSCLLDVVCFIFES